MAVSTTVGPLTAETRDMLASYRDRKGFPSYEEALRSILEDT